MGREIDDRYIKSISLTSLGITVFQEGQYDEAESYYREAMTHSQALNHRVTLSLLHCYAGLLALARNQTQAARESFQIGLAIAHESEIKSYLVYNLVGLACVYLAENKLPLSAKLLSAASAIAASINFKMELEIAQPYEKALATLREKMSETDFIAAQKAGAKMTSTEAVQCVQENQN